MAGLLEGRVAIVTGAGRGIGRAHALELASHGAAVVVNDFGVSLSGEGTGESPADEVVAAIEAAGGRAVANGADVADFEQAAAMVQQAIDTFGGLDILVNNAGFVRDRMLVNTSEEEWDAVIRVHLKGHFAPLRHAGAYWRAEAKEGRQRAARVINTSSGAGLQGSVGQATYSAAKAGIAGLTLVAAQELGRYGVTVNAIAPVARTRMTEGAFDTSQMALPEDNSPIVAWLASEEAGDVTGRVIEVDGGTITVESGWVHGPARDAGRRWVATEVGPALRDLLAEAPTPEPVYGAGVSSRTSPALSAAPEGESPQPGTGVTDAAAWSPRSTTHALTTSGPPGRVRRPFLPRIMRSRVVAGRRLARRVAGAWPARRRVARRSTPAGCPPPRPPSSRSMRRSSTSWQTRTAGLPDRPASSSPVSGGGRWRATGTAAALRPPQEVYSVTKSVTSTLVGLAEADGDLVHRRPRVDLHRRLAGHAVGDRDGASAALPVSVGGSGARRATTRTSIQETDRTAYAVGLDQRCAARARLGLQQRRDPDP